MYHSPAYRAAADPAYPFVLITGARKLLYLHSRFRNIPRFLTAIPGPEVEMHPDDAVVLESPTATRSGSRLASGRWRSR